jgi:thioredoxin-related protein
VRRTDTPGGQLDPSRILVSRDTKSLQRPRPRDRQPGAVLGGFEVRYTFVPVALAGACMLFAVNADRGSAQDEEDKPAWIRDLDGAKKEATASKKDLLIVFTGHGWCLHCQELDREVFQQAAFVEPAKRDFVFVEFDFTFGDTPEEKAREARFRKLQEKYLVHSFPTVVLADADGVPYAIQSGYAKGTGVTKSLALIRLAQVAKAQRDRNFKLAASATGVEGAEYLHKGVQAVAGLLGSMDDRGDDPVLTFYSAQVQDILKADTTDAGTVRGQYEARRKKRDEWVAREAVFTKLRDFDATKDYRGALKYLAEQLMRTDDRDLLWRLEKTRQAYLERDGQHDEALKNARRLSKRTDLGEADREWLFDREAYNLHNLGRVDELLAHYNNQIAAAKNDAKKRLGLLRAKAEIIRYHDRPEETLAARRAYREAAKPGSEDWLSATQGLAGELRKAGQHRAALKLVSEYLAVNKAAWLMLDAAESHLALAENDQARNMISQAEVASRVLKDSKNELDIKVFARIEERMKSLRKQLETKKPK